MPAALNDAVVLVTGATGFIGSHLVQRLTTERCVVHALVRNLTASAALDGLGVRCWTADLDDAPAVERGVRSILPDYVFHLAGMTASRASRSGNAIDHLEEAFRVNVEGTRHLLTALLRSARPTRIVRTGGIEEYGRSPCPYREDARELPVSPYGASQVAATHVCQMLHRQTGVPIVIVRPALVYGPRQGKTFFIPALIDACLAGRPFAMTDGRQTRDLIYVDDVVEGLLRAAVTPALDGEIINISSGCDYRIRDVAETVVRLTGGATPLQIGAVPRRPTDLDRLVSSRERAEALLDWRPRLELADGLARCVQSARALTGARQSASDL